MAKATLEYDLNDPDDRMAHLRAIKSTDMASALFEISLNLRKKLQYKLEAMEMNGEVVNAYETVSIAMEMILEIIQDDSGINIEELIN